MVSSIIFTTLLVLLCSKDVWTSDSRIVGGEEVNIQDYSYSAFLLIDIGEEYRECGGAILDQFYILTSASCLTDVQSVLVRIATPDKFFGGRTYETDIFYIHPMYDEMTHDYDIAIVVIDESMYLDGITPITMVRSGNDPWKAEDSIIFTGWGTTKEDGGATEYLRATEIPVVSREECFEHLSIEITLRMFCAGTEEGDPSPCVGDDGGPAVLSANGLLAGIHSFGLGCARPGIPHVYTRIGDDEIRDFINDMTSL